MIEGNLCIEFMERRATESFCLLNSYDAFMSASIGKDVQIPWYACLFGLHFIYPKGSGYDIKFRKWL